jgi:hypothetical protein
MLTDNMPGGLSENRNIKFYTFDVPDLMSISMLRSFKRTIKSLPLQDIN